MSNIDPTLASPFHLEWLVPMDETTAEDFERAVAEKAASILRSARFVGMHAEHQDTDMEVRVWIEAAVANGCVSITWEPGAGRYGFHLLDETLRDRLACVVFEKVPSIDAEESLGQTAKMLDAAIDALRDGRTLEDKAQLVRDTRSRRVEVQARDVDLGVDR